MEIIDELEPTRRGLRRLCDVLRLFWKPRLVHRAANDVLAGTKAYVQAGGGIVADSTPEAEFMETVNKSRALIRAIEIAEKEL